MATVPNRYYNSPWIEAAGQNLAAALAPRDPDKELATQRANWMFQRQQQLAEMEDADRQRAAELRGAFGDLATASSASDTMQPDNSAFSLLADVAKAAPGGMGAGAADTLGKLQSLGSVVTGQTKDDATRRAYELGASPDQIYSVTGQKTKDALALAGVKGDDARLLQLLRNSGHLDAVNATQAGLTGRSDAANALKRELNLTDNQFDYLIQLARNQGAVDAAHARGPGGGQLLDVSPGDTRDIGYELEDWASSLGVKLPPDQLYVAKTIATRVYQATRDSQRALDAAKQALYGTVTPKVNPGNPDSWLVPNAFGIDTVEDPSLSVRSRLAPGGASVPMTPQEILDEFNRDFAKQYAPQAAPAAAPSLSSPFNLNLPGLLPQGNLLPPGVGGAPMPGNRVRVDANGNVIR